MVYPLLPAYVTGGLGGGAAALGALDGAADAAAAFVKLIAGRLADRPERRGPLIVIGYFVAAAVRPIIAVTAAAWQVIGLRVIDRLGKGLRTPPRDALIGDVTPAPLVGRAFGLQRGLGHVGAVIGPLIAWWMLSTGADVRKVVVVRSSTSFVGGALSDRIGPSRTMWIGWLSYVVLAGGMALAATPLAAWLVFLALGVVAGLTESPERALVSAATGGHRGSGFGVYHALTGVAALVGGIALGLVFQRISGATAFLVS